MKLTIGQRWRWKYYDLSENLLSDLLVEIEVVKTQNLAVTKIVQIFYSDYSFDDKKDKIVNINLNSDNKLNNFTYFKNQEKANI